MAFSRISTTFMGFALLLGPSVRADIPSTHKCHAIESLGKMRVGDSIENFPVISHERDNFHANGEKANFYVYLLHSKLPSKCLNLQCGHFARQIIARGGFLVGGASEDYAREVGFQKSRAMEKPVLFVTDSSGKITAIYQDFYAENISEVLASIH